MKPIHSIWFFLIALAIFTLAMNASTIPDPATRALTALFVGSLVISIIVVFWQCVPTITLDQARARRADRRAKRNIDRANRIQADWMARR